MANLSNINNKFLVTTTGEVLVGRTAATGTSKLQVSGSLLIGTDISSGIPLVVQETTADGFAIGFMRNTNATNGNGLVIDVNSTAGSYIQDWRQASTVKMRLLQNGNLGIGITDPSAKLEVKENLYVSHPNAEEITFRLDNYGTTGTDAGSVLRMFNQAGNTVVNIDSRGGSSRDTYFNGGGNFGIGTTNPSRNLTIGDGSGNSVLAIVAATNGLSQIGLGDSDDDNYGQIILRHSDGLLQIQNGGGGGILERGLNITSSEDIGIGTTSPVKKLDVRGQLAISNSASSYWYLDRNDSTGYFEIFDDGNANRLTIDTSGNVGIGTDSPQANLHINNDTSNSYATLRLEGANRGGIINFYNSSYPTNQILGDQSGNMYIATSGAFASTTLSTKVTIKTTGNVGIGTTNPTSQLFVNNTADGDKIRWGRSDALVGSVGTYNGVPYIGYQGGAGGGIMFNGSSIEPTALGSTRSSATNDIGSSSYKWRNIYLSGGAYLGGTGSANLLDDYEEGTWTGTMANDGVGNTATGSYTKIGNRVFFEIYFAGKSVTNAGTADVTGFPFSANTNAGYGGAWYWHGNGTNQTVGGAYNTGTQTRLVVLNSTSIATWKIGAVWIMLAGCYKTTS